MHSNYYVVQELLSVHIIHNIFLNTPKYIYYTYIVQYSDLIYLLFSDFLFLYQVTI